MRGLPKNVFYSTRVAPYILHHKERSEPDAPCRLVSSRRVSHHSLPQTADDLLFLSLLLFEFHVKTKMVVNLTEQLC